MIVVIYTDCMNNKEKRYIFTLADRKIKDIGLNIKTLMATSFELAYIKKTFNTTQDQWYDNEAKKIFLHIVSKQKQYF